MKAERNSTDDRFPDGERVGLALAAAGQLEALSNALLEQMDDGPPPPEPILSVVARRVRDLARAIDAALGDRVATVESVERIVDQHESGRREESEGANG